ncbi:hypothetical protein GEMRC1_013409 [Eukaryota sp. GEM-RC1]
MPISISRAFKNSRNSAIKKLLLVDLPILGRRYGLSYGINLLPLSAERSRFRKETFQVPAGTKINTAEERKSQILRMLSAFCRDRKTAIALVFFSEPTKIRLINFDGKCTVEKVQQPLTGCPPDCLLSQLFKLCVFESDDALSSPKKEVFGDISDPDSSSVVGSSIDCSTQTEISGDITEVADDSDSSLDLNF